MAVFLLIIWLSAIPGAFFPLQYAVKSGFTQPEADWQLKKDENSIKVYTKPVSGSSVEAFRATTLLSCTIESLVEVARDPAGYSRWIADCRHSEQLKDWNNRHKTAYLQLHMPWPVKNRDLVLDVRLSPAGKSSSVLVNLKAEPQFIPDREDYVRIPAASGYFKFTQQANKQVLVEYEFHAEPGGSIPSGLVNSQIVKAPYQTLRNLKALVKG